MDHRTIDLPEELSGALSDLQMAELTTQLDLLREHQEAWSAQFPDQFLAVVGGKLLTDFSYTGIIDRLLAEYPGQLFALFMPYGPSAGGGCGGC